MPCQIASLFRHEDVVSSYKNVKVSLFKSVVGGGGSCLFPLII